MFSNYTLKRFLCLILALTLCVGIFAGCDRISDVLDLEEGTEDIPQDQNIDVTNTDEEDFDLLMDEYFADWVTGDSLSLNYYLADPDKFDIERPITSFGDVATPELIQQWKEETQELSDRLDGIRYENLRIDQKVVYDILSRNISLYNTMERYEDYSYYTGYIRPLIGFQVQLPILLAEFNFHTAEDIERYLELLADTHRYFNDMIEFERERSRRGYFLNDDNVDSITEQIESFLEDREDNLLISVFDDRMDNYAGLSTEQRESYKERNRELVFGNVIPAYETLLEAMRGLRGVGAREGGLANLPGGVEYAHALLRLRVGTDRSIEELSDLLGFWADRVWMEIMDTLHGEAQLYDQLVSGRLGQIAAGTPESYIATLQSSIVADFPPINPTNLVVLEVNESLQEHISPAFYLAPAIDRFDDNVVYFNPSKIREDLDLFTILAHESYPGHMYQIVYFLQQSPHPIRTALSNSGYTEGWAQYAEMKSYYYAGLDEIEATLFWNITFYDLLLTSFMDFGINIHGWSYDEAADILSAINPAYMGAMDWFYNTATGIPLNSLMYSLGYIELTILLNERERALGNSFDLFEFHKYILDFGPAPYPILRKYIDGIADAGSSKPPKHVEPAA